MLRAMAVWFVAFCSFVFLFSGGHAFSGATKRDFVLIGTGSMTGIYYSIGGGVCKFIVSGYAGLNPLKKLVCSTSSTAGSVYNLNSMRRGVMDIGAAQSDVGYYAYSGNGIYEGVPPMSDLRLLAYLHKEHFTIAVRKDSGIKTIDDIKGKRVNIGAPGTGVRNAMMTLFKVKGWTQKDFLVTSDLKSSEQVQALCDGKLDVISDFIGHPNAAMQEAVATCDAITLSFDRDFVRELIKEYPYYHKGLIPGNTYANNPNDTHTISVRASMYATTSLSDEMAYLVVKSIASNFSKFRELNGALKNLTLRDLVGQYGDAGTLNVPLHNGALGFYREVGFIE